MQVSRPPGMGGAYVMGLAFAFGWTPCIGPVLGAILGVAASKQTVGDGVVARGHGVTERGAEEYVMVAILSQDPEIAP